METGRGVPSEPPVIEAFLSRRKFAAAHRHIR